MPLLNNSSAFAPAATGGSNLSGLPTSSPISAAIRSWHKRYQSATNAGIPGQPIIDMARADLKNVVQGKQPMTNIQAAVATRARLQGKGDALGVQEGSDNGGLLGNIVSDVGDIGQALNPLHLIPTLGKEAWSAVSHPETTLAGAGHLIAGLAQLGPLTSEGTKELGLAEQTPGIRMIPGLMTAYDLGNDPSQLLKHPLTHLLDVSPYIGDAAGLLTKAIGGEEAVNAASKFKLGKEALKKTGAIPEELVLSPTEKIMAYGMNRHPIKMGLQAAMPEAMDTARAGLAAFQQRMGFGPIARYTSRMAEISKRGGIQQSEELLRPFNEAINGLTHEDKQLAFQVATRPDLHAPGSYPEHIGPAVQAVRDLGRNMEIVSNELPGQRLVRIPDIHGNEQIYNEGVPEEAKVIRSYERTQKLDADILEQKAQLAETRDRITPEAQAAQEAKIATMQAAYEKAAAGRAGVNAPGRSFTGMEPVNSLSTRFNDAVHAFFDNQDELKTLPIERVYGRVSEYNAIRNWMDANPDLPVKDVIAHIKENLSLEDKKLLVQHLEDNGISHVQLPRGKQIDIYNRFGIRKPGAIRTTQPQPSVAANLLGRLQAEKDALASGEYLNRNPELAKAQRSLDRTQAKALTEHDTFLERRASTPPASMSPLLSARIEVRVQAAYLKQQTAKLVGGHDYAIARTLPEALDEYAVTADPAHMIPQADYEAIKSDVASNWQDLVKQLQDEGKEQPVWVHNVSANAARAQMNIGRVGETIRTPSLLKRRAIDPSDSIADIEVAMTAAARDLMEKKWHAQYLEDHILPYTRTLDQIKPDLLMRAQIEGKTQGLLSERNWYHKLMGDAYTEFNPEGLFGFTTPKLTRYAEEKGQLWIPKDIANVAKGLLKPTEFKELGRKVSQVNQLFKFSVMGLSVKHMSHVLFGYNMFLALRGGLEELKWGNIREAMSAVKNDTMPVELARHMDMASPAQMIEIGVGNKMANFLKEHGNVERTLTAAFRMEENVTNIQRMLSYIGGRQRGLKSGLDTEAAHLAGLEHSYKTTLDIDSLTPFERTILKQVMPFYSYYRFLLSYVYHFPFDHPYRTAIINNIAKIERDDWDSGLPTMFQNYFNLGQPDSNGNVRTVDVRSLDPFRDLGTTLSFGGFLSQLNPLIATTAKLAGAKNMIGNQIYPDMKYDPTSGKMITAAPSVGTALSQYATSIVPEVQLPDLFLGLSQRMRTLKAQNPDAYNRAVQNNLFLPFTERTINLPQERQKAALSRLTEAQNAVSNTLKTGESLPAKFNLVPYQGKLVPRSFIEALIKKTKNYNAAPKSVLSKN